MKKALLVLILAWLLILCCCGTNHDQQIIYPTPKPTQIRVTPTSDPCMAILHELTRSYVVGNDELDKKIIAVADGCADEEMSLKIRILIEAKDTRALLSENY